MIVKIQRSLFSSDGKDRLLLYNEDRTVQYMQECTPEYEFFLQGELKVFAHAHLEGTELVIDRYAEWQDW